MKRSQVITRIETLKGLLEQGLVTEADLQASIAQQLADETIKPLPESAFQSAVEGIFEFAQKYGLVKVKKGPKAKGGPRHGSQALVAAQYPDAAEALAALEYFDGKVFEVTAEDGAVSKVQFQPFWRTVKEEEEKEASEGQVSV